VTLTFDLPEERQELFNALRGSQWVAAWDEIYREVRGQAKHGAESASWAADLKWLMHECAPVDWLQEE